ncbi:U-box domain-containing protein 40 [Momordica charantia]|uniref:RING-type E3 ubiquitin transferase n=1 Tax=Momordica charantia TaxID=3673 RepID=A0A6J1BWW5_MOMCH|nr:U-box domain-containing protein 40 [Momordica charantia]
MEFQEGLMKFMIHRPIKHKWVLERDSPSVAVSEITSSPRRKWRIFSRSSSSPFPSKPRLKEIPKELLCPISGSLMADPVIVSSGHTFEAACVHVCKELGFKPTLLDGSKPDFSSVIPNLALKSTIFNWCKNSSSESPKPLDFSSAEKLVRKFMADHSKTDAELIQGVAENPVVRFNHAATEVAHRASLFYSSSEESVSPTVSPLPLPLATRPSCCSSSSSSEIEITNLNSPEEEEIIAKLSSPQVIEIEEAVITLRKITRTREGTRVLLCTPQILSALRSLVVSRYTGIQVNSVAALVNLSLEKTNKVKIVRSGIVPNLIDVLKGGSPEVQEHASGAIFSLALHDDNKTAIGVLGALPPLIRLLLSDSEQTRHDSALALYHLSLVQSNRSKLVKLGSVPVFLGMVKSGQMAGRILLILCNLAACFEGRAALLDSGAVECLVGMLKEDELDSESTRESCVAVLFGLSHGGLRFKGLAKTAGAMEVFMAVEKTGSERAKEKAKRMMEMMKARDEEAEDVNWEELLDSGCFGSRTRCRLAAGMDRSTANSSEF